MDKDTREAVLDDAEIKEAQRAIGSQDNQPPLNNDSYNNGGDELPHDVASMEFLEQIDIPDSQKEVLNKFWAATAKDMKLSKLDDKDIKRVMLHFRTIKRGFGMTMSEEAFTPELQLTLDELTMLLYVRLKSSLDGFERRQLSSTTRTVNVTSSPGGGGGGGMKSRVAGIFGR